MDTEDVMTMESRIIEAAKQVFVRKGYEATKMSDIATEAGIGRTALHYYYRTKEMLFDAIFDQLMTSLLPNLGAIMEEKTSILEKLPKIIIQYGRVLQQNPLFPIFVISELHRDPEHLISSVMKDPSRIKPIISLQKQIQEEIEQGKLRKISPIYSASTLISLMAFPVLVREPLTRVFLEGDAARYDAFLEERIPFVTDIMLRMFSPDNNNPNN